MPTAQKRNAENRTLNERLIFRCDRADALELKAKAEREDATVSEIIRRRVFDGEETSQETQKELLNS